jgi:hypothetical protein
LRDDTRRESAALQLDPFLPTVGEIAHLMLKKEVVNTEKEVGEGEAQ